MNNVLCSIDWEKVVRVFSALLVPTIGVVTAYIAWQQYNTNRRQLRLALFDRRLKVFNSTMKLLARVIQAGKVEDDDFYKFVSNTREHEFLFGPDIGDFIKEVFEKAVEVDAAYANRQADAKARAELLGWFSGQTDEARKKFGKYMAFKEPE